MALHQKKHRIWVEFFEIRMADRHHHFLLPWMAE